MGSNQRGHGEIEDDFIEWLEGGGKGTRGQIADMYGISKTYTCLLVKRLEKQGLIQVVGKHTGPDTRGAIVDVLGYKEPGPAVIDIAAIVSSQPDLVRAWSGLL